jgi:hypothetical protein
VIRHDRFRDSILRAALVVFASFGCVSHPCAKGLPRKKSIDSSWRRGGADGVVPFAVEGVRLKVHKEVIVSCGHATTRPRTRAVRQCRVYRTSGRAAARA